MQFGDARTNKPFKLTEADLDRVAEALPQNVKDFIDEAKDLFERTYFNGLSRVNKNLKGYFLERVPGYWGIKLNRDFSQLRGVPDSWRGNYIRAMEMTGFLQEREGPSKTPILIGDFGVDLMLRSKSAATVIGKAETTKLLTQTVLHPDVVTTITRTLGVSTVQRIKNRVALYSGGDIADADERDFRKLLSMWSRSKTQLWVWTWIRNAVAGTPRMINEIGGKNVARNARPSLEAFKELKKYSPELRERWEAGGLGSFYDPAGADVSDATLGDAAKATAGNLIDTLTRAGKFDFTGSKQSLGGAWTAWGRVLDGITVANYFDAQPAITAYLHFKRVAPPTLSAEGKKRWAARQTVRAFERTSNTATIEYANDIQLQARKSLGVAMFVPFTGDTAKAQSMLYQALGKARAEKSVKPVLRTAAALALGSVMSAVVAVLRGAALGEDDEEKLTAMGARRFLQEIISLVPTGTIVSPLAMKVFDWATGTKTGSFSVIDTPFTAMVDQVWSITQDILNGIDRMGERQTRRAISAAERFLRAAERAAGLAGEMIGFPVGNYIGEVRRGFEGWSK
jgi:hypothetical protein